MFWRIVATALLAGLAAGLVLFAVQQLWVTPLILEAETFETAGAAGHGHGHGQPWAPQDGVERTLYTLLADVLNGFGFALLLGAAIALSGRQVNWRLGLVWGLAGYAVFGLAPALGLPPDPPGVDAGELVPRQAWWLGTAAATALGLWLLALTKGQALKALGVLALVAPHVIGAPTIDIHAGPVPPELINEFIAASLIGSAVFWLILGAMSGHLARARPGPL
ncbi:MAG: CbtA family protein [Rhodospirillales bacterium]|nr:CbtA family protein [Rhodospirillales bacterium]MDP6883876.1 CbtA family protein [Rhodospirillales bacterium]